MDTTNTLERLPKPEIIRQDLGAALRRAAYLRRLLKLVTAIQEKPPGEQALANCRPQVKGDAQ